jgi:molecular chaperone GrpE (heat shock protein)
VNDLHETESVELVEPAAQEVQVEDEGAETSSPVHDVGETASPNDTAAESMELSPQAALTALQPILTRLEQLEQTVTRLSTDISRLSEQAGLIPHQVRQLGSKVDGITESVSQPRIRDLLGSFLLLYDLIDQMSRTAESDTTSDQNYRVLRDQIAQALEVNGIRPIPEARSFDPAIHKAVETVACSTPDEDGEIVRFYRAGFRTERTVLRYAEVVVKRYQPPD